MYSKKHFAKTYHSYLIDCSSWLSVFDELGLIEVRFGNIPRWFPIHNPSHAHITLITICSHLFIFIHIWPNYTVSFQHQLHFLLPNRNHERVFLPKYADFRRILLPLWWIRGKGHRRDSDQRELGMVHVSIVLIRLIQSNPTIIIHPSSAAHTGISAIGSTWRAPKAARRACSRWRSA